MANTTKKYVSLDKLSLYDEKIKQLINTNDGEALKAAKAYADSLATNYDAAGSAAAVQGNLDKEIARAKAAEEANAAAAKAAQDDVDALELVVGGMYTNTQIDEAIAAAKTAATYNDAELRGLISDNADAISKEVTDREAAVKGVQDAVDALSKTHAADKTELEGKITAAQNAAQDAVDGVQDAVDELAGTHATDKKALEDAIALKADKTALDEVSAVANAAAVKADVDAAIEALEAEDERIAGLVTAEAERAAGVEADLEERLVKVETFFETAEGETIDQAMDTLVEIQKYITEDGAAAEEMVKNIAANAKAIEDMDKAYKAADETLQGNIDALEDVVDTKAAQSDLTALDGRVGTAEGKITTLEGKVSTLEGEMDAVEAAVAKKVETEAFNTKVGELEAADEAIEGRLDDIEAILGEGEGSVADQIATAKQEAIDAAAADATTKANKALEDAKKYADEEDAKIEARVDALETESAKHAAKTDLEALTGRVTTAEGKITTLEGKMTTAEGKIAVNEEAIADLVEVADTKADKATTLAGYGITDAYTKTETYTQAEVDAAITAAMDRIIEVSAEEINALFPTQA